MRDKSIECKKVHKKKNVLMTRGAKAEKGPRCCARALCQSNWDSQRMWTEWQAQQKAASEVARNVPATREKGTLSAGAQRVHPNQMKGQQKGPLKSCQELAATAKGPWTRGQAWRGRVK